MPSVVTQNWGKFIMVVSFELSNALSAPDMVEHHLHVCRACSRRYDTTTRRRTGGQTGDTGHCFLCQLEQFCDICDFFLII